MNFKFLLLTLIYAGGILWSSFQSGLAPETPVGWRMTLGSLLHIPAYTGLTILLILSFRDPLIRFKKALAISFVIAVVFGVINEFIQAGIPGRTYSVIDMINNGIGAAIGVGFFLILRINMKDEG